MSTNIVIRPYQSSDFSEVVGFLTAFQTELAEIDEAKIVKPFSTTQDDELYLRQLLQDAEQREGAVYVAQADQKVIGFIQGIVNRHIDGPLYLLSHNPGDHGWIGELYVIPEARSSGVGKQLIGTLNDFFRKKGCVNARLQVLATNEPAINLYTKLGFITRNLEMSFDLAG
jgi:ribosomal protein S18 acetylase RimI-like enzyme